MFTDALSEVLLSFRKLAFFAREDSEDYPLISSNFVYQKLRSVLRTKWCAVSLTASLIFLPFLSRLIILEKKLSCS